MTRAAGVPLSTTEKKHLSEVLKAHWEQWRAERKWEHCTVGTCKRKHKAHGLCSLHYQRKWKGVQKPSLLRSDCLRRVPLDDVAVNWLLGVFERLPRRRAQ